MKKLIITACLTMFLLNMQAQFTERKAGHIYYLTLPDYMSKTADLNDNASLQYMNGAKEAYIVVIEDSKEELDIAKMNFSNAKEFLENFSKSYMKDASDRKLTKTIEGKTANGFDMAQDELSYTSDGTKIWMLITVIETKGYFYKILTWSVAENKDNLKADYQKIVKSLREE